MILSFWVCPNFLRTYCIEAFLCLGELGLGFDRNSNVRFSGADWRGLASGTGRRPNFGRETERGRADRLGCRGLTSLGGYSLIQIPSDGRPFKATGENPLGHSSLRPACLRLQASAPRDHATDCTGIVVADGVRNHLSYGHRRPAEKSTGRSSSRRDRRTSPRVNCGRNAPRIFENRAQVE